MAAPKVIMKGSLLLFILANVLLSKAQSNGINYDSTSIEYFDDIINANNSDTSAYFRRAIIKLSQSYSNNYPYYLVEAIKDLDQAIHINPNYEEAIYHRGRTKHDLEKFNDAINDYDLAIELGFNIEWIISYRADAKYNLGDYTGAIQDYNIEIKINNKDEDHGQWHNRLPYYNRGIAKDSLGDNIGARIDYARARIIWPDIEYGYGLAAFLGGRKDEAIILFSRLIEDVDPHRIVAFEYRGKSYMSLGKRVEAIADFTTVIEASKSGSESCYLDRGICKRELEDYTGAINDFSELIRIHPAIESFFNRGITYHEIGEYELAIKDYTNVLDVDTTHMLAYYNRGLAKVAIKQNDSGCADLRRAGELGMSDAYKMIRDYCNN